MTAQMLSGLSPGIESLLCCPVCRAALRRTDAGYVCARPTASHEFPEVHNVPILLNDDESLFRTADYLHSGHDSCAKTVSLWSRVYSLLPSLTLNLKAAENYARLAQILGADPFPARVLVVGGRIVGEGLEALLAEGKLQVIETDIAFGPRTQMICDVHSLPFRDESFDAVIAQAVLEHVVDPYRATSEIHRVLKPDGLIYAEIPFMQQGHGQAFDFTRFTALGNRRLFRYFSEIDSGIANGPGTALAWSIRYFAQSLFTMPMARRLSIALAHLMFFWLKYVDRYIAHNPAAFNAASGFYFFGRRSETPLADRDLIELYRGV